MSNYFSLDYSDLSYEKQEDLKETVVRYLMEKWQPIGEEYMTKRKWYVTPKNWQEAFCRIETIDWEMWNDLDEKSDEFQKYDWKYSLEEYAEKQAEDALWTACKYLEIEVEI